MHSSALHCIAGLRRKSDRSLYQGSICHQSSVHCHPSISLHVYIPISTAIANAVFSIYDLGWVSNLLCFTFLEDFQCFCKTFGFYFYLSDAKKVLAFRLSFGREDKIGQFARYLAFPTRQPGDEIWASPPAIHRNAHTTPCIAVKYKKKSELLLQNTVHLQCIVHCT